MPARRSQNHKLAKRSQNDAWRSDDDSQRGLCDYMIHERCSCQKIKISTANSQRKRKEKETSTSSKLKTQA